MKVKTIHNIILQSCSYILYEQDESDCYLVDCGDINPILYFLHENKKILRGIFLTHSHYDHIYGLNEIIKVYPQIPVFGSKLTIEGIQNADINLSYMYDCGDYIVDNANTIDVEDCSQIIFDLKVNILPTPGHDIDCITYIIGDNIFTGDSFNPDFEVFTKWRRSSEMDAMNSIHIITDLIKERNLNLFPGHYK